MDTPVLRESCPLVGSRTFPLNSSAENAFEILKADLENPVVQNIDESLPFELECDASDLAIVGVLNPAGRPVPFFHKHFMDLRESGLQ